MVNFDAPEIQRCNLSSAVLQLIAMGQSPFQFEYIDNPGRESSESCMFAADSVLAAFQTLAGLEAISGPDTITPLGRQMLLYPLDPGHARILISALSLNCVSEIIDILSLLDAGPVWVDKQNEREASAAAKAKFVSRDGDHLTGMNVLRAYMELKEAAGGVGKWAKENYVNLKTINSALKVRQQLRELVKRHGNDPDLSAGDDTEKVRRCLLAGLFMNTAVIQSDGTYRQAAGNLVCLSQTRLQLDNRANGRPSRSILARS
jgi:ATP-dependent RNA helicase DHX33